MHTEIKKDRLRLKWTTIVGPEEYDIQFDMEELARLHNSSKPGRGLWVSVDPGKVIGLYNAWLGLKREREAK